MISSSLLLRCRTIYKNATSSIKTTSRYCHHHHQQQRSSINSRFLSSSVSLLLQKPKISSSSSINQDYRFFSSSSSSNNSTQENNDDDDDDNNKKINIIEQPPNLKIDERSTISPFYGLKRIEEEDDDYDDYEDEEGEEDDDGKEKLEGSDEAVVEEEDDEYDDEYDEDDDDYDDETILYDGNSKNIDENLLYVKPLPDRLNIEVKDFETNEITGTIWLDDKIWGIDDIRVDLMHKVVVYQRNKKRGKRNAGAITKTISTVSGSGRKVRPQKGQGKARAGHSRPPHWRGGVKAHGPKGKIQDYTTKINKKVKRLGIINALSQKLKENNLIVVNNMILKDYKTKNLVKILNNNWNIAVKNGDVSYKAYMLDHAVNITNNKNKNNNNNNNKNSNNTDEEEKVEKEFDETEAIYVRTASRNLSHQLKVVNQMRCNVYDLLNHDKLMITVNGLMELEKRLLKPAR